MKDKAKRDKEQIEFLAKQLDDMTGRYFKHRDMGQRLVALALKSGVDRSDIFAIIEDSHSLRKML
jgi:hypothetical protein